MKSKSIFIAPALLFIALVALVSFGAKGKHIAIPDSELKQANRTTVTSPYGLLSLNGHRIKIEIADTSEKRTFGLGGRDTIGDDEGMLFVFPKPDLYGFWMSGMRFSLDIVWLDEQLKVVDMKENVSPETYPDIFLPRTKALYVLEVKGNVARKSGITRGSILTLKQNTPL